RATRRTPAQKDCCQHTQEAAASWHPPAFVESRSAALAHRAAVRSKTDRCSSHRGSVRRSPGLGQHDRHMMRLAFAVSLLSLLVLPSCAGAMIHLPSVLDGPANDIPPGGGGGGGAAGRG